MNINDYFDPVSLEKPAISLLKETNTFGRCINIHTPDNPIRNISEFDIAILGVQEDRNALIKGTASAPDKIREKLYLLGYVNKKTKIADLGNLKISDNINDSYYGLRDIILELMEKNVLAIVLGGSQDLSLSFALAMEKDPGFCNLTSIDSRLDFGWEKEAINSNNYLDKIFKLKNAPRLNYINIGHQVYFTSPHLLDKLDTSGHESIRLGDARANIQNMEPVLRDSDILSIDIGCVRQSDSPGASLPSPNGFFGHELCQLTRYAGASDKIKVIGFFEINPDKDLNCLTSHLAAQSLWYFIEGFSLKTSEDPRMGNSKKFIVKENKPSDNMIFYKSMLTDRWWIELPIEDSQTGRNQIIACSYEDYTQACKSEIPDRWWRRMRKYS